MLKMVSNNGLRNAACDGTSHQAVLSPLFGAHPQWMARAICGDRKLCFAHKSGTEEDGGFIAIHQGM